MENDKLKLYPHASRRALWRATDALGMTRGQGRLAYTNMKNALRRQGLRGSELRQTARWNIMDQAFTPKPDVTMSPIQRPINTSEMRLTAVEPGLAGTPMSTLPTKRPDAPVFTGQNFNSAFANARKMGLNEFEWNGSRYNTKLASESFTKPSPVNGASIDNMTTNGKQIIDPQFDGNPQSFAYKPFVSQGKLGTGLNQQMRQESQRQQDPFTNVLGTDWLKGVK